MQKKHKGIPNSNEFEPIEDVETKETPEWMVRQVGYNEASEYGSKYHSRLGRAYLRRRCEILVGEIKKQFPSDQALELLEIGCGAGHTLKYLSEHTNHSLLGMDFSKTMLRYAAKRTRKLANKPYMLLANAIELPFEDNSFNVVYATRFMHQFPHSDKIKMSAEFKRVLKPNGFVLLEFYARPMNILNYYIPFSRSDRYKSLKTHLIHYPSVQEKKEITTFDYRTISLRFFLDRVVNRVFGYGMFTLLNTIVTGPPPFRWLMDEHWVTYSPKSNGTSKSTSTPTEKIALLNKVRCAKCHNALEKTEESGAVTKLTCYACKLIYGVEDGLPNLLSHEAKSLSEVIPFSSEDG